MLVIVAKVKTEQDTYGQLMQDRHGELAPDCNLFAFGILIHKKRPNGMHIE